MTEELGLPDPSQYGIFQSGTDGGRHWNVNIECFWSSYLVVKSICLVSLLKHSVFLQMAIMDSLAVTKSFTQIISSVPGALLYLLVFFLTGILYRLLWCILTIFLFFTCGLDFVLNWADVDGWGSWEAVSYARVPHWHSQWLELEFETSDPRRLAPDEENKIILCKQGTCQWGNLQFLHPSAQLCPVLKELLTDCMMAHLAVGTVA